MSSTAVQGLSIDIRTPDGIADAYLTHPDDGIPHPGVLVFQDGFGLRPSLRTLADRIAAHGYTVLLPNLYYRHGRAPVVEMPGLIDPERRPELFGRVLPMIRELTPEVVRSDAGAFLAWLEKSPQVTAGPVGLTGYCMGARPVVFTAAMFPERVAAGAGFHGGPFVTDSPDSPHLMVETITAELYLGHAGADHEKAPDHTTEFDKALDAAGVRYRTEIYEGAQHGYTQADTSAHDPEAAERHYRALLDLFDRNLRPADG